MGTRRDCSWPWGDTLSLGADPDAWGGGGGQELGQSPPFQGGPALLPPPGLQHTAHCTPSGAANTCNNTWLMTILAL